MSVARVASEQTLDRFSSRLARFKTAKLGPGPSLVTAAVPDLHTRPAQARGGDRHVRLGLRPGFAKNLHHMPVPLIFSGPPDEERRSHVLTLGKLNSA